jgi:sporulation protein YlmC with PRC-barrel domain
MLRTMKELEGYAIRATDGDIGRVKDVYFDDERWVVRYLVVETGSWLSSRKVLISPFAIGQPDWAGKVLPVSITQQQVKDSPDIDTDKPVSRQHEMQYLGYYGYPYYWGGAGLWGNGLSPSMMLISGGYGGGYTGDDPDRTAVGAARNEDGDPHLRSCKETMNYHIEASNGGIGHVRGLLIEENTWAIRYMIVDTSNWWLGHQVLIAPQWIQDVRWPDNTVTVNMTQQAVKDAPPYDAAVPLSREQEMGLYRHHGRAGYWADEVQLENPQFHVATPASHGSEHRTGGDTGSGQNRPPAG